MKSHTKNIIWKFAIIAALLMVVYNFFGHYLIAARTVIPVKRMVHSAFYSIASINCRLIRLLTNIGGKRIIRLLHSLSDLL